MDVTPPVGPMIRYLDVVPMLRAASPSFDHSADAAAAHPDDGEFVTVGAFVEHLIGLAIDGSTDSFPAVFDVIERVLADGDLEARNLVVGGLLDDLTNPDLFRRYALQPRDFAAWLGRRARRVPSVRAMLDADLL
jgi:hypothetical protein